MCHEKLAFGELPLKKKQDNAGNQYAIRKTELSEFAV